MDLEDESLVEQVGRPHSVPHAARAPASVISVQRERVGERECVCERERASERESEREREREREAHKQPVEEPRRKCRIPV